MRMEITLILKSVRAAFQNHKSLYRHKEMRYTQLDNAFYVSRQVSRSYNVLTLSPVYLRRVRGDIASKMTGEVFILAHVHFNY